MPNNTYKLICVLNPEYFVDKVLGYDMRPHHRAILSHILSNRISLNLCSRGHGKSTIGNIAFCIYKIIQDRNIRILVVSNTNIQAISFLRECKNQFESNTKLLDLFGTFQATQKWTESEMTVAGRTSIKKESTLTALGATGALTGKHFDIIIADDITDFESSRTELQRTKLSEWYRTSLLPSLEPGGQLVVLGTRYAPTDLYQELVNSGQYNVQVQRAIMEDGTPLWPGKFPIEDLLRKKEELGSLIFDLQFQNSIELARAGHIFKYEWLTFYDTAPATLKIYQGVDLAIAQSETSDYFVLCTIGHDTKTGLFYVLDIFRQRLSFNSQLDIIKKKAQQWNPVSIGIESNAYQKALSGELIRTTSLPIKQLTTQKDKVSRAQRRSALFENGKIRIRKDMTVLIDELCLFPDSAHDDTFDALDFALSTHDIMNMPKPTIPVFPPSFFVSRDGQTSSDKQGFDRYLERQRLRIKALSQPQYKSGVY
jgi:predicted phage terminase large subunit-like protein